MLISYLNTKTATLTRADIPTMAASHTMLDRKRFIVAPFSWNIFFISCTDEVEMLSLKLAVVCSTALM
jgi:hypothetical protein